jgi:hypothetical protein
MSNTAAHMPQSSTREPGSLYGITRPRRTISTTGASPLFRADVGGTPRSLVSLVGKEGLLRILDRQSRSQIAAVAVTRRENVEVPVTVEGVYACPGVLGGVQWNGPAFSPRTNMLYVPSVEWCGTFKKAQALVHVPGQNYLGGTYQPDPMDKSRGWLTAIDPHEFVEAHHREYPGAHLSYHTAFGYGGCQVLTKAVRRAGSLDREKIRAAILKLDFNTVFGAFKVDQDGLQIAHKMVIFQWQDGKRVIVWPAEVAPVKARFPTPPWSQRP